MAIMWSGIPRSCICYQLNIASFTRYFFLHTSVFMVVHLLTFKNFCMFINHQETFAQTRNHYLLLFLPTQNHMVTVLSPLLHLPYGINFHFMSRLQTLNMFKNILTKYMTNLALSLPFQQSSSLDGSTAAAALLQTV